MVGQQRADGDELENAGNFGGTPRFDQQPPLSARSNISEPEVTFGTGSLVMPKVRDSPSPRPALPPVAEGSRPTTPADGSPDARRRGRGTATARVDGPGSPGFGDAPAPPVALPPVQPGPPDRHEAIAPTAPKPSPFPAQPGIAPPPMPTGVPPPPPAPRWQAPAQSAYGEQAQTYDPYTGTYQPAAYAQPPAPPTYEGYDKSGTVEVRVGGAWRGRCRFCCCVGVLVACVVVIAGAA